MSDTAPLFPPQAQALAARDLPLWREARFTAEGLIPVIAQQHDTLEVLMMAWMNRESLAETLLTGRACYWSRSRGRPWRKGETSGQHQRVVDLRLDCDGDTVLLLVDQDGAACHTGRRTCFYRAADATGALATLSAPLVDPETLYGPKGGHP